MPNYLVRKLKLNKTEQLDSLARAAGKLYSQTLVSFWRTVRKKGVWLSGYTMEKWHTSPSLHAHSSDAVTQSFYSSLKSWRARRKTDPNSKPPRKRRWYFKVIWKSAAIKLKNSQLILSNGKGNKPLIIDWYWEKPKIIELGWNKASQCYEIRACYSSECGMHRRIPSYPRKASILPVAGRILACRIPIPPHSTPNSFGVGRGRMHSGAIADLDGSSLMSGNPPAGLPPFPVEEQMAGWVGGGGDLRLHRRSVSTVDSNPDPARQLLQRGEPPQRTVSRMHSRGTPVLGFPQVEEVPSRKAGCIPHLLVAAADLGEIHPMVIADGVNTDIFNGRHLRSIRQYQNKLKAKLSELIDKKKRGSKRRKKLIKSKQKQLASVNNQVKDIEHKLTSRAVSMLKERSIQTLVIGDVRDIRDDINYGKKNNQKLHQWSFGSIRQKLEYKCAKVGIKTTLITEEYTSQECLCCRKRNKPSKRNYKCSSCHSKFHRDVVGSNNIRAKYLGEVPVVGLMASPSGVRFHAHLQCNPTWNPELGNPPNFIRAE